MDADPLEPLYEKSRAAHRALVGEIVAVIGFRAYINDTDDVGEVEAGDGEAPFYVRVVETPDADLTHVSCDDWVDPYWDVDVLPDARLPFAPRSAWIDAPNYHPVEAGTPGQLWVEEEN